MTDNFKFDLKDIQIDKINDVYDGYFKIREISFTHRLFRGGWSDLITREVFERAEAVALLLYDPLTDEVVLIEQVRVGAILANSPPWQLEIIAGMMDKNHCPQDVAIREANEEAGICVQTLLPIFPYLSSSGGCSERIHLYLGLIDASKAQGVHGLVTEGEDILVHVVAREKAMACLQDGRIENAASIIALQWLALNVDANRRIWQGK